MKRVYKDVAIRRVDNGEFEVQLDTKPIKTAAGKPFLLASDRLANSIASEWDSQSDEIDPETMPFTRLASMTLDRTSADRDAGILALLEFLKTDLLCHRATEPQDLVTLQSHRFDPMLDWFEQRCEQSLVVVRGVMPAEQPDNVIAAAARHLAELAPAELTVMLVAAPLTSSFVLPLALAKDRITGPEAFQVAFVDDLFQIRKWGQDKEAVARLETIKMELTVLQRYLFLQE